MSQENIETVRRILEKWATGDFAAGARDLDPHVLFVVRAPFPEPCVVTGPDGVRDYMLRFLEQWERFSVEATGFKASGDTVLAEVIQRGKGKSSGAEVKTPHFMLFTFRGRKILGIESVLGETEALEAAGLSK